MKHFKKSLEILLSVGLIVFSAQISTPSSSADVLTSPFNLQLSAPSAIALLNGVSQFKVPSGNLQTLIPNQTVNVPYPVQIEGIHLNLNYVFQTPEAITSLNAYKIQSSSISGSIVIDTIDAIQTVVLQSGGATIRVQVHALCNHVRLDLLPNSTSANGTIGVEFTGDHANYVLKDFNASWTPAAWQITSLTCTGPQGFGDLVRQNIQASLTSINPFVPEIKTQIQNQLNVASDQPITWTVKAPGDANVTVTLKPTNLQVLASGSALVAGKASFDFAKLQNTTCAKAVAGTPNTPTANDTLTFPVNAIESLFSCAYQSGFLTASFTSEQFTAFKSLLGDFPLKLLIWPNLNRFTSGDVFGFNFSLDTAPEFEFDRTDTSGNFNFYLDSALTLAVYAPTGDGNTTHYVDFSTVLSGPATFSVANGILNFTQTNRKLKLKKYWDQNYLDHNTVDQCIWTGIIGGYLKKYLSHTGVTYTLPTLTQANAFSLGVSAAQMAGDSAVISLNIGSLVK
jgi:hypothetical protein